MFKKVETYKLIEMAKIYARWNDVELLKQVKAELERRGAKL